MIDCAIKKLHYYYYFFAILVQTHFLQKGERIIIDMCLSVSQLGEVGGTYAVIGKFNFCVNNKHRYLLKKMYKRNYAFFLNIILFINATLHI